MRFAVCRIFRVFLLLLLSADEHNVVVRMIKTVGPNRIEEA